MSSAENLNTPEELKELESAHQLAARPIIYPLPEGASAQFELARRLGRPYDFNLKLRILRGLAAEQNYPPAQFELAIMLLSKDLDRNADHPHQEEIEALLRKAADQNYAPAQVELVVLLMFRKTQQNQHKKVAENEDQVQNLLEKAAAQNYAPAQYGLAALLSKKNQKRAIDLFIQADQQGYAEVCAELVCLSSDSESFKYYIKAIKLGYKFNEAFMGCSPALDNALNRFVYNQDFYLTLKKLADAGYTEVQYFLAKQYSEYLEKRLDPSVCEQLKEDATEVNVQKYAGQAHLAGRILYGIPQQLQPSSALLYQPLYFFLNPVEGEAEQQDFAAERLLGQWDKDAWLLCYRNSEAWLRAPGPQPLEQEAKQEQESDVQPTKYLGYAIPEEAHAQLEFALQFISIQPELSIIVLRKAVEQNYAPAEFELAMRLLAWGRHHVKNSVQEEREELLRKAADQNYAPAQVELAVLLMFRKIQQSQHKKVAENEDQVQNLLEKAADQNYAPAQYTLALKINNNNPSKAERLLALAGDQGHAAVFHELMKRQLPKNPRLAFDSYIKAIQLGYRFSKRQAQREIYSILDNCLNQAECYARLKELAKAGYTEAQHALAAQYIKHQNKSFQDGCAEFKADATEENITRYLRLAYLSGYEQNGNCLKHYPGILQGAEKQELYSYCFLNKKQPELGAESFAEEDLFPEWKEKEWLSVYNNKSQWRRPFGYQPEVPKPLLIAEESPEGGLSNSPSTGGDPNQARQKAKAARFHRKQKRAAYGRMAAFVITAALTVGVLVFGITAAIADISIITAFSSPAVLLALGAGNILTGSLILGGAAVLAGLITVGIFVFLLSPSASPKNKSSSEEIIPLVKPEDSGNLPRGAKGSDIPLVLVSKERQESGSSNRSVMGRNSGR